MQAGAEEHRLLDRLWDTYGVTHQGAQALRQDIPDAGQAQRQCGRLRDDIAALGNVNLGAVEEFQRVEERWQYLTDQKNDVETARQALEGVIDGITQEMDQRFRTEFAKIRTAFAETFARLFGGGKGMLALEDEKTPCTAASTSRPSRRESGSGASACSPAGSGRWWPSRCTLPFCGSGPRPFA